MALLAALLAITTLAAAPVAAQTVLISGHANYPGLGGPLTFAFVAPQSPVPSSTVGGTSAFAVPANGSIVTAGGMTIPLPATLTFSLGGACGGFDIFVGATDYADACGPVLFTGAVTSPTFVPGTYTGFTNRSVVPAPLATVQDVTITATPEPASIALVGTGLLGVGMLVRRRRRSAPSA